MLRECKIDKLIILLVIIFFAFEHMGWYKPHHWWKNIVEKTFMGRECWFAWGRSVGSRGKGVLVELSMQKTFKSKESDKGLNFGLG